MYLFLFIYFCFNQIYLFIFYTVFSKYFHRPCHSLVAPDPWTEVLKWEGLVGRTWYDDGSKSFSFHYTFLWRTVHSLLKFLSARITLNKVKSHEQNRGVRKMMYTSYITSSPLIKVKWSCLFEQYVKTC